MKKIIALLVLIAGCYAGVGRPVISGGTSGSGGGTKRGDVIGSFGISKVSHSAELTGGGTLASPLSFTPCSSNQSWVWNGSSWACSTVGAGTITNIATGTGLTGGPITTTGTISLANTAVTAGSYTLAGITVDAQGRLTAASNYAGTTAPSDKAVTALSAAGVGTFAYFYDSPGTGLATGATGNIVKLADTAVTPGSYTIANITVDQQGRIIAAANGSAVTSIIAGTGLSGGTITSTGTISLPNTGPGVSSYTYSSITLDAQGRITAASSGAAPVTNSAGNNIVTKSNGTNLVASDISDDGTTIDLTNAAAKFTVKVATGNLSFAGTQIGGTTNSAEIIGNAAATATVPTIIPYSGSTTTGLGAHASGDWSLIAGGTETMWASSSGITAAVTMSMSSTKITSLANGTASSDAAAFGQIGTAVNAAVSGTTNTTAKFTGTNAIGNGWASDDGTTWGVASKFTVTEASGNAKTFGTFESGGNATMDAITFFGSSGQGYVDGAGNGQLACAYSTNSAATCKIDNVGYSDGQTQYRSLEIDDGHGGVMATFSAGASPTITLNDNTTIGASTANAHTINGNSSVNGNVGTTMSSLNFGGANFSLYDQTAFAQGVGGGIAFKGKTDSVPTLTQAAGIKALKSNSVSGDTGFDLAFGVTKNGNTDITEQLDLESTGSLQMLGQGLAVGGLYQGQAQDVADVFNSGLIRKNLAYYSDDLENGTLAKDSAWGDINNGSTMSYTTSTAVNAPWYPSTITPAAGGIGKITCTSGSPACTTQTAAYYMFWATSATTGITDLRTKTVTFSVWLQPASGTLSAVVIALGRYNDNDVGSVTCPSMTAGTWTRCVYTRTYSNTSYTDNSEIRAYIYISAAASLYVAGAQIELGSVPTAYEPNDAHVYRGSEGYVGIAGLLDNVSMTSTTLTGTTDPGPGSWDHTLGVGNTKEDPNGGIASDGTLFGTNAYVTSNFAALGGFRTGQASSTNYGFMSYDNSGHIMTILADNHAGTSEIDLATSNSAHAATQVSITSALVTITPPTTFATTSATGPSLTVNSSATTFAATIRSGAASGTTPQASVGGILLDGTSGSYIDFASASSSSGLLFSDSSGTNDGAVVYNNVASRTLSFYAGGADQVDITSSSATFKNVVALSAATTDVIQSSLAASSGNQSLQIDAAGTGTIVFNGTTSASNSGTGGLALWAGNNSANVVWKIDGNGHRHYANGGGTPTASGSTCGTSPTIVGDDNHGMITIGTGGATACQINFAHSWSSGTCNITSPTATAFTSYTAAPTSSITINGTLGATTKFVWTCGDTQ